MRESTTSYSDGILSLPNSFDTLPQRGQRIRVKFIPNHSNSMDYIRFYFCANGENGSSVENGYRWQSRRYSGSANRLRVFNSDGTIQRIASNSDSIDHGDMHESRIDLRKNGTDVQLTNLNTNDIKTKLVTDDTTFDTGEFGFGFRSRYSGTTTHWIDEIQIENI